jgi:hypothetical protein
MNLLPIFSFALLAMILMSMLAKTRPYSKVERTGKVLQEMPLSLLSKVWLHRFSLTALITGLALTGLAGWLPSNMIFMVAAFAVVIVLLPMRLTLTSKGFAVGDAVFRTWDEFTGMKLSKSKLELQNPSFFVRTVFFLNPVKNMQTIKNFQSHIPVTIPND